MPLESLKARVASGELAHDPIQIEIAERLDELAHRFRIRELEPAAKTGLIGRLFGQQREKAKKAPKGLYIHGGVGRGKSMLMDIFFERVEGVTKRRVHFHEFMQEVHSRLREVRKEEGGTDPLARIAADLARDARLLCFDEFHVVNIADAMILGRLFTGLFEEGVTVVATSNWAPDRLYEDGLNRERFTPFIELLKTRVDVVALDGQTDYRLGRVIDARTYHYPVDGKAHAELDRIFAELADGAAPGPESLPVQGRMLEVPAAARGVARFAFADLCARPLGPADYLALTARFQAIVLDAVPLLTPNRRNEARRFMTLVDALYERKVMLFMSAEAEADALYPEGDGAFEFQRTVSRLMEMQSPGYLDACRNRHPEDLPQTFTPFALTSDLS